MIALALVPVFAVLVAAPTGPDDACPSARQVTEAMQARFPASVLSPPEPLASGRSDVLRAVLDVAADGTVVRFSLVDARGDTQLRRTLPAPGRGRPVSDCLALADTLAVIVERYLGAISYDAPEVVLPDPVVSPPVVAIVPPQPATQPSPPTTRAALITVGLGWRMPAGQGAEGEIEGRLGVDVELTRLSPRLAATFSVGAAPAIEATFNWSGQARTVTLGRFPARLGASLHLPAGPGWVEPGAVLALDLLTRSTSLEPGGATSRSYRLAPGLEALVAYRLKIAGPFHLRARAGIGYAIQRYDVGIEGESPIFSTPRAHASFGIDTGVLFR